MIRGPTAVVVTLDPALVGSVPLVQRMATPSCDAVPGAWLAATEPGMRTAQREATTAPTASAACDDPAQAWRAA